MCNSILRSFGSTRDLPRARAPWSFGGGIEFSFELVKVLVCFYWSGEDSALKGIEAGSLSTFRSNPAWQPPSNIWWNYVHLPYLLLLNILFLYKVNDIEWITRISLAENIVPLHCKTHLSHARGTSLLAEALFLVFADWSKHQEKSLC